MSLVITCPSCGLQGRIRDRSAVTAPVQCPQCGAAVPLPDAWDRPAPSARTERVPKPLDEFFARALVAPDSGSLNAAPAGAALTEPEPLADGEMPGDAGSEGEWVREERLRLQSYMQTHFALLKQQREEFASWRSRVEAALVAREQELNRQQKVLAGRNEMVLAVEASVTGARPPWRPSTNCSPPHQQALQEKQAAHRSTVEQFHNEATQMREQASVREQELNRQQEVLDSRNETVQALEANVAEHEAALATQHELLAADRQALREEQAAQRSAVEQLHNEAIQVREQTNVREQELNLQQEVLDGRSETVQALEAHVAQREAALATQHELLAAAHQALQRLQEEHVAHRSAVEQFHNEATQMREQASVREQELNRQQEVFDGRNETVQALEAHVAEREAALATQHELLAADQRAWQEEHAAQRSAVEQFHKEATQVREETSRTRAELQELQEAVRRQRQLRGEMDRRQVALENGQRAPAATARRSGSNRAAPSARNWPASIARWCARPRRWNAPPPVDAGVRRKKSAPPQARRRQPLAGTRPANCCGTATTVP